MGFFGHDSALPPGSLSLPLGNRCTPYVPPGRGLLLSSYLCSGIGSCCEHLVARQQVGDGLLQSFFQETQPGLARNHPGCATEVTSPASFTINNIYARQHRTCTTCIRLHRTSPRQASLGPACPGADDVWSSSNVHKGLSHANFHLYRDLRGAPRSVPSTARPSAGGPGLHFTSPLLFPALRLDIGSLIEPLVERFTRSRLRCPDFNRTVVHGGTLCSRLRVRFGC